MRFPLHQTLIKFFSTPFLHLKQRNASKKKGILLLTMEPRSIGLGMQNTCTNFSLAAVAVVVGWMGCHWIQHRRRVVTT